MNNQKRLQHFVVYYGKLLWDNNNLYRTARSCRAFSQLLSKCKYPSLRYIIMQSRPRRGIRYANGRGTEVLPLNGSHRLTPARTSCFCILIRSRMLHTTQKVFFLLPPLKCLLIISVFGNDGIVYGMAVRTLHRLSLYHYVKEWS